MWSDVLWQAVTYFEAEHMDTELLDFLLMSYVTHIYVHYSVCYRLEEFIEWDCVLYSHRDKWYMYWYMTLTKEIFTFELRCLLCLRFCLRWIISLSKIFCRLLIIIGYYISESSSFESVHTKNMVFSTFRSPWLCSFVVNSLILLVMSKVNVQFYKVVIKRVTFSCSYQTISTISFILP